MLYSQTINLYNLLGDKGLLKLSYNQILNCADYFIFNRGFYYLVLDKIRMAVKEKKYFVSFFLKNEGLHSKFDQILIIEQVIANILDKVFKNRFSLRPLYFKILKVNKVQKNVDRALKTTLFSIQLHNFRIINNKIVLKYILKLINTRVLDNQFNNFLKRFFLIKRYVNIQNIFSHKTKFYQVVCDIYLCQLDMLIIKLFKEKNWLSKEFVNFNSKGYKKPEMVIENALFLIKDKNLGFVNRFLKQLMQKKKATMTYVRHLGHILLSIDRKPFFLNKLKKTIIFFCKSHLQLNFELRTTAHSKKSIIFCGISKKTKPNLIIETFCCLKKIKMQFVNFKIINTTGEPLPISYLLLLYNSMILTWYNYLMLSLKNYFKSSLNYTKLINTLYYFLKWSLLQTLQKKHKKKLGAVVLGYLKKQYFAKKLKPWYYKNLAYIYKNSV